ncbi:unnamed protein product, partial [Chrysoparadoxa australica]
CLQAPTTEEGVQSSLRMSNIWIAASDGDLARVVELVKGGASVNAKDENGYTPVHAAASYAHMQLLDWLVANGGNVGIQDSDGDTPLHHCEAVEPAQWLIAHGAEKEARNCEGLTAADAALEDRNEALMAYYGVKPPPDEVLPVSYRQLNHSSCTRLLMTSLAAPFVFYWLGQRSAVSFGSHHTMLYGLLLAADHASLKNA